MEYKDIQVCNLNIQVSFGIFENLMYLILYKIVYIELLMIKE